VNNSRRYYTQEQLAELIQKIESRIDEYLSELDSQDAQTQGVAGAPTQPELAAKLAQLKEKKQDCSQLLESLQAAGQNAVALTDADSRKMLGPHGYVVGYNVQVAVDAKNHLIATQEVVQDQCDRGQLSAMAIAAKEELQVEQLEVTADAGYHQVDQLQACEQANIQAFVPEQRTTSGQSKGGAKVFPKEAFAYDAATDSYTCPAGQRLPRVTKTGENKEPIVYLSRSACGACAQKSHCTTGKYRSITRLINEAMFKSTAARVTAHPEKVARRKEIVEHVFGTLRMWGHDNFLTRGLEKVRGEFSLSALVYNLRRVLNLISLAELMKSINLPQGEAKMAN
jgi:hypothetical protein